MSTIPLVETLAEGVTLIPGNCLDVLTTLEANSIDSCVTDPPYGLEFMGKAWDHRVPGVRYWKLVYRVLKPGAHLLAFGGTRTNHRMVCAIEDAGFEIRDTIQWVYGSGFPKSHDISKAIDRAAGAERGTSYVPNYKNNTHGNGFGGNGESEPPVTDLARQWSGFGTALKPACEPIVLARKPLSEPTIAANVLKWGTGAINVDGCRVGTDGGCAGAGAGAGAVVFSDGLNGTFAKPVPGMGRWPANLIHDGSKEVVRAFPESKAGNEIAERGTGGIWSPSSGLPCGPQYGDSGSAARFFYTAKADSDDRLGSHHPTVKPLDLMQYLVRLVTSPKGLCLDPFAGTGTTGEAAWREGMRAVLIEREVEYQDEIRRRMRFVLGGPNERAHEAIKQKLKRKNEPVDNGPLFSSPLL
jgi:DNA modification methylase